LAKRNSSFYNTSAAPGLGTIDLRHNYMTSGRLFSPEVRPVCRVASAMTWHQVSALSISGLAIGVCVLTCALCCCCRRHRQRLRSRRASRARDVYQRHAFYDDDDDDADLFACACCPTTSGLYACKRLLPGNNHRRVLLTECVCVCTPYSLVF